MLFGVLLVSASSLADDGGLPQLDESVRVPTPRFAPATRSEYLASVFTLWNLLDGTIHKHRDRPRPIWPYGYMRRVQLEAYSRLVWQRPNVRTYCETGVNGGHGTAAMLAASPTLVAHSFDEVAQPYSEDVFKLLTTYFRDRWVPHRGNSHVELPRQASGALKGSCDVVLVDGDHSADGAYRDIVDFRRLASCGATVLLDDVGGTGAKLNNGPSIALTRARDQGLLEIVEWHIYNKTSAENPCLREKHGGKPMCVGSWGFAIARYKQGGRCDSVRQANAD